FQGKSNLSLASAILEKEPEPVSSVQPMAPPALDHVVRGCLAKNPDERWQSAGDIARELRWISSSGSSQTNIPTLAHRKTHNRERCAWIALSAILLVSLAWLAMRPQPPARVVQAVLTPPPGVTFAANGDFSGPPVLTRDGTHIVFSARVGREPI